MREVKANGRNLGQEARMVMRADEHAIIKAMLWKVLGDDDCSCSPGSSRGWSASSRYAGGPQDHRLSSGSPIEVL
jgi:hypothetical protein